MIWKIEVFSIKQTNFIDLISQIRDLGISKDIKVTFKKIYFIEANLTYQAINKIAQELLIDPVCEHYTITEGIFDKRPSFDEIVITYNPGVCDPVAISLEKALRDLSLEAENIRTARFYKFKGLDKKEIRHLATKLLYNPLIEHIMEYKKNKNLSTLDEFAGSHYKFDLREIDVLGAGDDELVKISQEGFLSLSLEEMKIIQNYFKGKGRNPTDCELETIAQTWSEHCAHKTFRGIIEYEERDPNFNLLEKKRINNLLKLTIMRATQEIESPFCVSVFCDNSGIVDFNECFNICFKVETHNHPSSLEPYGGASTGIGGVIRDILGTGRSAKPVASVDVFCFSPWKLPYQDLPPNILHPKRIIKGVVRGVRDYGNKMGIPTVAGAVIFDERFLGNPLVFCGTIGLIPKEKSHKEVRPGDLIVLCGARTGRDGIHGATFSSTELDQDTVTLTSAVQIGNPIEEKKVVEALLRARDKDLFSAITDCGAGGLSSAVSELSKDFGAKVFLEKVPLKYRGLTYTEIWISESQERMVLFTQKDKLPELKRIFEEEETELIVIGEVTNDKKLTLFYQGERVCQLDMDFLFGIPTLEKRAVWIKKEEETIRLEEKSNYNEDLCELLGSPNISPKDWIITQYDHEVGGGSVLKPFLNTDRFAVSDGSVIRPDLESKRCLAIGLGINPFYSDIDPYWMAALCIDEAIRNVICLGGCLERTFLLDNFSWGAPSDENILAGLVRASFACYDFARFFGTPFISGKDSLHNEYVVEGKRIVIPGTLLISAISVVDDWQKVIKNTFSKDGNLIYVVGLTKPELGASEYFRNLGINKGQVPKVEKNAREIFTKLSQAVARGLIESCHDCSEGGLSVAISEMCIGGSLGANIFVEEIPKKVDMLNYEILFSESPSRFIVEVSKEKKDDFERQMSGLPLGLIGCISKDERVVFYGKDHQPIINIGLKDLKEAWLSGFKEFRFE
jgi:phosphoribosylformylglycinamidine synthase